MPLLFFVGRRESKVGGDERTYRTIYKIVSRCKLRFIRIFISVCTVAALLGMLDLRKFCGRNRISLMIAGKTKKSQKSCRKEKES